MKKLILSIVFALATLPMFSYSLETLYVFSYLHKYREVMDPTAGDMYCKYKSPCYYTVEIVDCSEQPDNSYWGDFGIPDKNFNMEFGLYEVRYPYAYLLIHHKSLSIYMGSTLDKLLERIIEIKEKEPNLITEAQFINILRNIFRDSVHRHLSWLDEEAKVFEIDGMRVYYEK